MATKGFIAQFLPRSGGLGVANYTAAATAGAATLHASSGTITSEALTTLAAAEYTLTLTNNKIGVNDIILWSVGNGTNTGTPGAGGVSPAAGSAVFTVTNLGAGAFDGTIKVRYLIVSVR